jgi:hypothetical protein
MKLSELIKTLVKCQATLGENDPEVLTCFEDLGPYREDFHLDQTEIISDIRTMHDWPLPGKSVLFVENEKPVKVIIFYRNDDN